MRTVYKTANMYTITGQVPFDIEKNVIKYHIAIGNLLCPLVILTFFGLFRIWFGHDIRRLEPSSKGYMCALHNIVCNIFNIMVVPFGCDSTLHNEMADNNMENDYDSKIYVLLKKHISDTRNQDTAEPPTKKMCSKEEAENKLALIKNTFNFNQAYSMAKDFSQFILFKK